MNYNDYKIAHDRAWQTLIETKVNILPINLKEIFKYYNIELKTFINDTDEAFIKNNIVYFNKNYNIKRIRFTLAHELGHILLKHENLNHTVHTYNSIEEYQANIFARCLLMPAIVLKELNCIEPQNIANMCKVSLQAAEYRSKRMKELLLKNRFNLSPLERQVYNNFKNFIS